MEPRELANFRWMARHRRLSTRSKMRSVLASIPCPSCRKISSKPYGPPENDEPLVRVSRQRRPRQMRAFSYGKRKAVDVSRLSHGEAPGCPTSRAWVNWHEGGLRQRRYSCLL